MTYNEVRGFLLSDDINIEGLKILIKTSITENTIRLEHSEKDMRIRESWGNERFDKDLREENEKLEIVLHQLEKTRHPSIVPEFQPIQWNGKNADLARIVKALQNANLISISGRNISKHFTTNKGQPMPLDFLECLTSKQDHYSKDPKTRGLQKLIEEIIKSEE